jgi:hypothetical protein
MAIVCELHDIQHIHLTRRTSALWLFLVSCLGISKTASKDLNWVCRWTSFGSPINSGRNQRSHFISGFPGVDQQIRLIHCPEWKVFGMSKQWSIELFLTALRFVDAHPIVGRPIFRWLCVRYEERIHWIYLLPCRYMSWPHNTKNEAPQSSR